MKKKQTKKSGLGVYKRLLRYVWPYKGWFIISTLAYMIASATQPLFAEMLKQVVDTLQSSERKDAIYLPLYFSGLIMVRSLAVFVGAYFVSRVSAFVVYDLQRQIFNHYTKLPISYFDTNNSGLLISRVTNNVQQVTGASTDAVRTIIREGMTAIALLGYLFYINWKLSLVFLAISPAIIFLVTVVGRRLRKLSKRILTSLGDLTQIVSEIVSGSRIVRSYGGEDYERTRFNKESNYFRNQAMKVAVTSSLQNPAMQMIVACALSGLMYMALIFMEDASAGEFVAFLTAAFMLPRAIKFISGANSTIQKGIAAAESLFEVLDIETEKDHGSIEIDKCKGEIAFKQLTFSYAGADKPAVRDIDFEIHAGQTVALVGASGSGKSTLTNLLIRFYDHDQGQITIDGIDVNELKLECLRKQIALVTQNITLFDDSVRMNIAYGEKEVDEQRLRQAAEDAYAMEFIDQLDQGMDTRIGEHGVKLSGGQRQRIAIARAIYKNAPILVLDEATSALDTRSERYIQSALEKVMQNRTTLVIAHRLSTIESADVILVMHQGRIIERGNHQELIANNGEYAKLQQMQFTESAATNEENI